MSGRKEIGGYFELECFGGKSFHEGALALNCGRGCISYLVEARAIREVWVPRLICSSVPDRLRDHGVGVHYYGIDEAFVPLWSEIEPSDGDYLYLVDYYGQLSDDVVERGLEEFCDRVIVDESQGFFSRPRVGVDTLYTTRKYFGVSDGGYLYTTASLERELPRDESFDRMRFVLGRLERTASEFFKDAQRNNALFEDEPAKLMSAVTESLLSAVDYEHVQRTREQNYAFLEHYLGAANGLAIESPSGPFAYPLLVRDGLAAKKTLAARKIYVATYWPNVLKETDPASVEYRFASDILPLPVDQRYGEDDMATVIEALREEGIV